MHTTEPIKLINQSRADRSHFQASIFIYVPITRCITSEELKKWGVIPDISASPHTAKALAEGLLKEKELDRVIFPSSRIADKEIPQTLQKEGVHVEQVVLYDTVVDATKKVRLLEVLKTPPDFITFMSPSSVDAFVQMASLTPLFSPLISIGPKTTKRLEAYKMKGFTADPHTPEGMIEKMKEVLHVSHRSP